MQDLLIVADATGMRAVVFVESRKHSWGRKTYIGWQLRMVLEGPW